ncbi:MAG: hypothetical protein II261_08755 [Bacteroidaceae bacterium]|nr:hypothetical protein [Bacteroidaceae bacterium]
MKLSLNSAPASLFETTSTNEREKLVCLGRLLMAEANGRAINSVKTKNNSYTPTMDDMTYRQTNENTRNKVMLFCASHSAKLDGREAPANYQAFLSESRDYFKNPFFLRTLSGVVTDIVRPMLPFVLSNAVGELGHVEYVPLGQTMEIAVESNDIFLFQDSSWGASRSVPENTLYPATVTLNPTPRTASATVKWYQLVGNDADFGMWLNSLYAGLYSKIMGLWNSAMVAAAANAKYVPDFLKFATYNSSNFNSAVELVSSINHVNSSDLMVYGSRSALGKLLPSGTAQDAALTYGLGAEWMRNGYLGTIQGVPSFELLNAVVPGTQNTTGQLVLGNDQVYIAARKGIGYAPIYIGMEDGTPITLELTPDKTADMTLNVNVTASLDVKAVFGSKIAVMTGLNG